MTDDILVGSLIEQTLDTMDVSGLTCIMSKLDALRDNLITDLTNCILSNVLKDESLSVEFCIYSDEGLKRSAYYHGPICTGVVMSTMNKVDRVHDSVRITLSGKDHNLKKGYMIDNIYIVDRDMKNRIDIFEVITDIVNLLRNEITNRRELTKHQDTNNVIIGYFKKRLDR